MGRQVIKRFSFWALVVAAPYYAVFGGEYSALELYGIGRRVREAQAAAVQLEGETEQLARRVEALENDVRTLATLARESFGMIREDEVLYRFADSGHFEGETP
jgi:cell division protein FtsB